MKKILLLLSISILLLSSCAKEDTLLPVRIQYDYDYGWVHEFNVYYCPQSTKWPLRYWFAGYQMNKSTDYITHVDTTIIVKRNEVIVVQATLDALKTIPCKVSYDGKSQTQNINQEGAFFTIN